MYFVPEDNQMVARYEVLGNETESPPRTLRFTFARLNSVEDTYSAIT